MNNKEIRQLAIVCDEVINNIPGTLKPRCLATGFSKGFIDELRETVPDIHISVAPKASIKYDVVLKNTNKTLHVNDLIKNSSLLKTGGILAVFAPNPSKREKSDTKYTLSKASDKLLIKKQLETKFREPFGKFWRVNKFKSPTIERLAEKLENLPNSKFYSPYMVTILRLDKQPVYKKYRERTSPLSRLLRLGHRSPLMQPIINLSKEIMLKSKDRQDYQLAIKSIKSIRPNTEDKRKPILICMTYFNMGGVERVMLNIIKGLDRDKFIIHVMTTEKSGNPWLQRFKEVSDNIVVLPETINPQWPAKNHSEYIFKYIVANNISTMLITNSIVAYRATRKIKKELGSTIKIYDLLHTHGTPADRDAYLKSSMPFDKFIDKRLVISEYLKKYYTERYPVNPSKVAVIYNGIDKKQLTKVTLAKKPDKFFTKMPSDKKIITYIGRLETDKSPLRLVQIAEQLKKDGIPAAVLVVGGGSEGAKMKNLAEQLGIINEYIYFYGPSNNPLKLLSGSDFTINVSNAEGISMSILESMSHQVPAIASEVGGTPEIIDHNLNGLLVDINSVKSEKEKVGLFVESIEAACRLNRKEKLQMGQKARQKIDSRFSSMDEEYEKLLLG